MVFEKSITVSPEEIRSIDVADLAGALIADRDGKLSRLISAYLQESRFKLKSLVDRGVTPAEHAAYREVEQGIDAAERVLTAAVKANALREPR